MISANITPRARKEVYQRDHYRCVLCDSTKYIQIHHVVPRSDGGNSSAHNLVTLCSDCHMLAHEGIRSTVNPDFEITPEDIQQSCFEYLADFYAPDHWPYRHRYDPRLWK